MLVTGNYPHNFSPVQKKNAKNKGSICIQDNYPAYKSLYTDIRMNKNNAGVFFTGLQYTEPVEFPDPVNKTGNYQCDTFFFRDIDTLNVMKDYLQEHFPEGTHIADFGCSNGEETRTIAMLLSDINQDNKYTITGYDTSMNNIDDADEGFYHIGLNFDRFLNQPEDKLPKEIQGVKKLFDEHFIRRPDMDEMGEKCFEANEDKFGCLNYFTGGNISDVDKLLEEHEKDDGKKTGVVVFKNGWYHLTQSKPGDTYLPKEYDDLSDLKTVLRKINKALPENGILVTGSLPRDHIIGEDAYHYDEVTLENSPFHKALKECGFEPVKESAIRVPPQPSAMEFILYKNTKVYSIWKKASSA